MTEMGKKICFANILQQVIYVSRKPKMTYQNVVVNRENNHIQESWPKILLIRFVRKNDTEMTLSGTGDDQL